MAKKRNDKVLVIDVESTCQENPRDWLPGEQSEIIEIGLVVLNRTTFKMEEKRSILIKPIVSTVSKFCEELTSLTQDMIDGAGISYASACSILKNEYKSNERLWLSWGDYDYSMFERMSHLHKCQNPLNGRHINLKTLFGMFKNLDRDPGMPEALQIAGLELTGTHHRGHDDAENIANLARYLIKKT